MKKKFYILLIFFLILAETYGQFTPSIHNYTLADYNAGNQNWDITRADDGKVYAANSSGLLEYDGLIWKFYQLPNKTIIRSVLAVDDMVFTGSYEEFGYWKRNEYGALRYYSLSNNMMNPVSPNEEIWDIIKFKDKVIFKSFYNIYIYDFEKVIKIRPISTVISLSVIEDDLYISTLNQGIFLLKNNELKPFYFSNQLLDTKIISIDKYKDDLLIMTSLKGSFFLRNQSLVPTKFKINKEIKLHQLNTFSILSNREMVFGTIKNGVFLTDNEGNLKFHISKENGLHNNTVLGQLLDKNDNLWLGLDNGISNIELNNSNYFYNDVSGKLGAVYDIIEFKDVIYIGTNTGLFRLDKNDKLKFIEGTQGQVWNLKIIEDELFCGHNEGTFLVDKDKIKKISPYTGGWTIKKVPERNHTYIQGTYSGLVKFEKQFGEWKVKHLGKTTIPSRFLVFEDPHTAWIAHATKGVYKINFDEKYDTINTVKSYDNKGVNSNYNVRIYNLKNNISFKTSKGWQKYEPILDSIIAYDLLNKKLGKDSYIISEEDTDIFALKVNNGLVSFKSFSSNDEKLVLSNRFLKNRYIVGYENVSKIKDSIYALNLYNGFLIINNTSKPKVKLFKPKIEVISVGKVPINISNINTKGVSISYSENITVEISSANSINHFFEYKITNTGTWYRVNNNKIKFSNLNNGDYIFSFRTTDNSGNVSEIQYLNIAVLPPWYKGKIGGIVYLFLFVFIVLLFYAIYKKKIVREQRLIKIGLQKEQQKLLHKKSLENEKRIVQLKNTSLKNEIKLKSKQLANTAVTLVKKNEILLEVKEEFIKNKNNFSNYFMYKKLLKKLDNSIVHKDEWEIFEYNFNQVNEEFFNSLKSEFTDLTPKDLKLCAYIKMNLSTKEIAPLMNISIRGVETHRYRLKKKLNLDNHILLSSFLMNFK